MKHLYHQIQLGPLEDLMCRECNKDDHYTEFSWYEKVPCWTLYLTWYALYTLLSSGLTREIKARKHNVKIYLKFQVSYLDELLLRFAGYDRLRRLI